MQFVFVYNEIKSLNKLIILKDLHYDFTTI